MKKGHEKRVEDINSFSQKSINENILSESSPLYILLNTDIIGWCVDNEYTFSRICFILDHAHKNSNWKVLGNELGLTHEQIEDCSTVNCMTRCVVFYWSLTKPSTVEKIYKHVRNVNSFAAGILYETIYGDPLCKFCGSSPRDTIIYPCKCKVACHDCSMKYFDKNCECGTKVLYHRHPNKK
jgi:hypothetical protein